MAPQPKSYSFFYRNGLLLVFGSLLLLALTGQIITGRSEYNEELKEYGQEPVGWGAYLQSGHFISATFENWESEFLQMGLFVGLTIFLRQLGAPDSKPLGKEKESKKLVKADSPWPVRRGGIWLKLYENSLLIAYLLFFLLSAGLHVYGSWQHYNMEQQLKKLPLASLSEFFGESKVWFESFQNWQSEFLSVASLVLLSIYLRQKGSPESKEVEAPHNETGK